MSMSLSFVHRYAVAIATAACTAILIVGTGCSSCFVTKPQTNENKGPELELNFVDTLNYSNNLKDIPAQRFNGSVPPTTLKNVQNNYNYQFFIVATDPGGIASFDYSASFGSGCPCQGGAGSGAGCTNSIASVVPPAGTVTPNPDGTVPILQFAIVGDSAAQERAFNECFGSFSNTLVTGTYTISATAKNPSGKKSGATWIIIIP
jgi:hypothetical protein